MEVFKTIGEYRRWRKSLGSVQTVGFVPTMGALHAGHLKLIEAAKAGNDLVVVSLFVNPLQFGPGEDYARYPRPFDTDAALCRYAGVTALFAPEPEDFYLPGHATYCEVTGLDRHLCGASRPGHFRGVCTVVLKLFNIIEPHRAYFGQKDIQQAVILRKMAQDLSLNLDVEWVETVREPSGLALSSRNLYLSPDEKMRASALHRGLAKGKEAYMRGERNAEKLIGFARAEIEASSPTHVDYVELVSQAKLEPIAAVEEPAVLAVAVYYGTTRLIDNALLS